LYEPPLPPTVPLVVFPSPQSIVAVKSAVLDVVLLASLNPAFRLTD